MVQLTDVAKKRVSNVCYLYLVVQDERVTERATGSAFVQ